MNTNEPIHKGAPSSASAMLRKSIWLIALIWLHAAAFCYAASDHELRVGAQVEQICSAELLEVAGRFAGIRPDNTGEQNAIASACKEMPGDRRLQIVAAAYPTKKEDFKLLLVAIVEKEKRRVVSSYQKELEEDASMHLESGSLWIDTAAYDLANGKRAFGVDITGGYTANCGDGGGGAERTLFVRENEHLRPILQDLPVSMWVFIQRGRDRCTDDRAPKKSIIENVDLFISVAPTASNGYRDLLITWKSTRDDGRPSKRKPFRYRLQYDGQKYDTKEMMRGFWKWRS